MASIQGIEVKVPGSQSGDDDVLRNRSCDDYASCKDQNCPSDVDVAVHLIGAHDLVIPESTKKVTLIARRCSLLCVEESSLAVKR